MNPSDPARLKNEREYLRFLVHAGEMLASSLDFQETMMNVCAAAVETVADICALYLPNDDGDLEMIASASRDNAILPTIAGARFLTPQAGYPEPIAAEVARTGNAIFVPEVTEQYIQSHAISPEHGEFIRTLEYASVIVVPVRETGAQSTGALALVRTRSTPERFNGDAVLFAQDLARRCGGAIARSRAFAESQQIAQRFQRATLPRSLPSVPGLRFDAYYEPAESSLLVGGDWYDAFLLPDGRIGMTVGDVTGHGLDAAAFMGNVRNALRTALCAGLPLDEALNVADYLVRLQSEQGHYATTNLATLDVTTGVLSLISAGHPGPMIALKSGRVIDAFQARGLPLGLRDLSDEPQPVAELRIERGTLIVFFTDGLIEWERDELTGYRQLENALRDPALATASNRAKAVRQAVVRGSHADDIAIMCVST